MARTIKRKLLNTGDSEMVEIDSLLPHPRNVNEGDAGAIHESMKQNGFWGTLIVQKSTRFILAGNHRAAVAKTLGYKELPVTWVDVDDRKALNILLSDNRTARLGTDNPALLAELLQELAATTEGLDGTGYYGDDLDQLLKDLGDAPIPASSGLLPGVDPDDVPDNVPTRCKLGDLWRLGEHYLLNADSTVPDNIARLMQGNLAQLVFTDPPYGVNYEGGLGSKRDKLIGDDNTDLYAPCANTAFRFSDDKAAFYMWHADLKVEAAYAAVAAAGYVVRSVIIWNKQQAQFGALSAQYKQKHEPAYYCYKKGKIARWYGPTNEVTVWDIDRAAKNEFHPTQKSVALSVRALSNNTQPGDIVLDLFGGSGSTLIGAESAGRKSRICELDSYYCDVILARWENATGQTAELVNG